MNEADEIAIDSHDVIRRQKNQARYSEKRIVDPIRLLATETAASDTPAAAGRLSFVRNDNLYSQKLNRGTRKLEGDAALIVDGVISNPNGLIRRGDFSDDP